MWVQMLLFFPPLASASFALSRLVSAAQAYARLEARPTTPLAQLREGPIEVAGVLRATDAIDAISHVPCAALKLRAALVETGGTRKTYHLIQTFTLIADAVLEDGQGNSLAIPETHEVSIQAPAYLGGELPLTDVDPAWRARFGADDDRSATHLAVEEFRIEDGATVTMQGVVERVDANDTAYRGGAAYRLVPPQGEPILLFRGNEADARRTALRTCLAMAVVLAVLLDLVIQVLRFG